MDCVLCRQNISLLVLGLQTNICAVGGSPGWEVVAS